MQRIGIITNDLFKLTNKSRNTPVKIQIAKEQFKTNYWPDFYLN